MVFTRTCPLPVNKKMLKIFSYGWHTAHQHELCKLPDTHFYYIKNRIKPDWSTANRPYPKNLDVVTHYEAGKYDLAILHIDQQCLFGHPKGIPYNECNKMIKDIPKIVINHGTPHYQDYEPEMIARRMKEAIGDNFMVVNSYKAAEEWGFGKVIQHGLEAEEWIDNPVKENRIIVTISPGNAEGDHTKDGWAEYYNRFFLDKVKEQVPITHIGSDITFDNFQAYKEYIGSSLIYFNPTLHSPMPRSRTEAMLSGACVVTTPFHDADTFIENGVNGFIVKTEKEAVKTLKYLLDNPEKAKEIGQRGKKTAMRKFEKKRYQAEWLDFIASVFDSGWLPIELSELKNKLMDLYQIIYFSPNSLDKQTKTSFESLLETVLKDHNKRIIEKYGKNRDSDSNA